MNDDPSPDAADALMRVMGMCLGELAAILGAQEARRELELLTGNDDFWDALPTLRSGALVGADEAMRVRKGGDA